MSRLMHRRLVRLEQAAFDKLPWRPWLVLNPGKEAPDGWEAAYGGVVRITTSDGRKPFPIFEGERLRLDAWPNHLLVPMEGPRPEGEPIPYCLERVAP